MCANRVDRSTALAGAKLPAGALRVLAALEGAGHEAWVVGGWVRDTLMGRPGHDVDMCCSAPWQESAAALEAAGIGVIESGVKFGGITAVADGERIEVTTYRVDGFYTDGRHPEAVAAAACVEDDLARRDFTVNAMAWHPERGLLDLFGGVGDIEAGLIRAVGDPRTRFEEDALRMLRAVRFACRLGFALEARTATALAACAPLLDAVARERVGWELDGILGTPRAGWAMLECPELFCAAVPELAPCRGFDQETVYHVYDVYDHIAHVLDGVARMPRRCDAAASVSLAWAALFHDAAKPSCFTRDAEGHGHFYGHPQEGARLARSVMRRLGLAETLVREVELLVRYHDASPACDRSDLLELLSKLSIAGDDTPRLFDALIDLRCADALSKTAFCRPFVSELERIRALGHRLIEDGEPYTVRQLAIDGRTLMSRGVQGGPRIGELLRRALAGCMAGEVENERGALLAYLGI